MFDLNRFQSLDKGKVTSVILLDFSKAFDALLTPKRIFFGFNGTLLRFFTIYLLNMYQKVIIVKNLLCFLSSVNSGVPQGFVLWPLCFSLYVSDLHKSLNRIKIHYYSGFFV